MNSDFSLLPLQMQGPDLAKLTDDCNALTAPYGLVLSQQQLLALTERRFQALKATGRVEFGEGIVQRLAYTFGDSPYISQHNYEETLAELQDIFYYFKNESMDTLADDELLEAMKSVFDGRAQGSLEYLTGTALEDLCRILRDGTPEELEDEEEDYE